MFLLSIFVLFFKFYCVDEAYLVSIIYCSYMFARTLETLDNGGILQVIMYVMGLGMIICSGTGTPAPALKLNYHASKTYTSLLWFYVLLTFSVFLIYFAVFRLL